MTGETFREYAKKEQLFDDCIKAIDFVDMLKHEQRQTSFKNPYLKAPLLSKARGLITMPVMFDNSVFKVDDYDALPINDFNKLLEDYGNWYIDDIGGENSYNHDAPTETYVNVNDISLTSPNFDKSVHVVLFSCGLSLDATGAYTKNMIVVFASEDDLIEFMLNPFLVGQGYFNYNGKKYYYNLSAEAFSDEYSVYVTDDTTFQKKNGACYENTFDEVWTDSTDKKQLTSDLQDLLNDEFGINKAVTNLSVEYFCEPNF